MKRIQVPLIDGEMKQCAVYSVDEFLERLPACVWIGTRKKNRKSYLNHFIAFDIETTTVSGDPPTAFMYLWQICFCGIVCMGRTWPEFTRLLQAMIDFYNADDEHYIVIYVHNLSFEFQFMRNFLQEQFDRPEVFATAKRTPLKVTYFAGLEFRCSYKLTNMTLDNAIKNEKGCKYGKALGFLDYSLIRTCDTQLTERELVYSALDVLGLEDLIINRMRNYGDNLERIPLTSTGYVRRIMRQECRKDKSYHKDVFLKSRMNGDVYAILKEAARGGDTHANRFFSGRIWDNVDSYDEVSGYPAMLLLNDFPMNRFTLYGRVSVKEIEELSNDYCVVFRALFKDIHIKKGKPMPYIPIAKCRHLGDYAGDNGRVLKADVLEITLTECDFKIIKNQYDWKDAIFYDCYRSEKAPLPEPIRETILKFYIQKCELKDKIKHASGEELFNLNYMYAKTKNLLNSVFGMMFTDPIRDLITFDGKEWQEDRVIDIDTALIKFYANRNSFLNYAWGVWTTAYNRVHIHELIRHVEHPIYMDTDSCKGIDIDASIVEELNKAIRARCEERGAYADVAGKRYYLGEYAKENNEPIKKFITLGSKKYAYEDEEGLHVTVSGVQKFAVDENGQHFAISALELGLIENFKIGFVFEKAGGKEAYYNDTDKITMRTVTDYQGHKSTFIASSNVALVDGVYTLGITDEYAQLLNNLY